MKGQKRREKLGIDKIWEMEEARETQKTQEKGGLLTEGPILTVLTKLALPIMASSFLSTAYSITDMAWIGSLGSKAVAGVGAGGMYAWLSQGLSILARMGGQVYVAQTMGKGENGEAQRYAQAAVQMVLLFGVLFGAACFFFSGPMVGFFGIEDPVTVEYGKTYLKITCGLILFSYINYTLTGLFTAQGDSGTPLKANSVGLVINMICDPLLILGVGPFPRMEVTGAAAATVGAQVVVMLVLLGEIFYSSKTRENVLRNIRLTEKVKKEYYSRVFRMGLPAALQSSFYCMISMILTRMVAAFGEGGVAVQRVGGQIESISWNMADGFAAALNAFVGQNYGAGRMDRVKKGYRISFAAMAIWGGLITLVFVLLPEPIAKIFFHERQVIEIAKGYLRIVGLSEGFMCVELMAIGAISGLGRTRLCSTISVALTVMRIPLAMLLVGTGLELTGIWWALTLTSMIKGAVLHGVFLHITGRTASRTL